MLRGLRCFWSARLLKYSDDLFEQFIDFGVRGTVSAFWPGRADLDEVILVAEKIYLRIYVGSADLH